MYKWSVILSEPNALEYELLSDTFQSKKNAQLFAENYVFDFISKVDGINRIDPFSSLNSGGMKDLEVDRIYISKIVEDQTITNLGRHYILGNTPGAKEPWGLTVHKLNISTRPVITTSVEEIMEEREVEEDKEIKKEITFVIPGRIYNGYEKKIVVETVKEKVKKMVPVQITREYNSTERVVKSTKLFTISLLRSKVEDVVSLVEKAQAQTAAINLARAFSQTKTAQTILSAVGVKVSDLLFFHSEEFGKYKPPKRSKSLLDAVSLPIKKGVSVDLRKATSTMKLNVGASLAGFGAEVVKRRLEMYPELRE